MSSPNYSRNSKSPTIFTSTTNPTVVVSSNSQNIHPASLPGSTKTVIVRSSSPRPASPIVVNKSSGRLSPRPVIEEEEILSDQEEGNVIENIYSQESNSNVYSNDITDLEVEELKNTVPLENTITIISKALTIRQPGIERYTQDLISMPGYGLRIFSVESTMLPEQSKKYDNELDGISDFKSSKTGYGLYVPVTNFLYPKNIYDPSMPRDTLTNEGGWISKDIVTGLGNLSPKLEFLVNTVKQRINRRHVIHTNYLERYGVDLLVALLRASGIIPLVCTYDYRTGGGWIRGNTSKQHIEVVKAFNSNPKFNVIITNMKMLDLPLYDIDYLHFVDPVGFDSFAGILNKIYHAQYYRLRRVLTIIFHICKRADNSPSLDLEYFEKLGIDIGQKSAAGFRLTP